MLQCGIEFSFFPFFFLSLDLHIATPCARSDCTQSSSISNVIANTHTYTHTSFTQLIPHIFGFLLIRLLPLFIFCYLVPPVCNASLSSFSFSLRYFLLFFFTTLHTHILTQSTKSLSQSAVHRDGTDFFICTSFSLLKSLDSTSRQGLVP
jgi:hypothetical protein